MTNIQLNIINKIHKIIHTYAFYKFTKDFYVKQMPLFRTFYSSNNREKQSSAYRSQIPQKY